MDNNRVRSFLYFDVLYNQNSLCMADKVDYLPNLPLINWDISYIELSAVIEVDYT